jgi:hypothetical protein
MMLGGFVWASYELVAAFRASDVSGEWEYGIESCLAISLFAAMMTQPLNQRATVSITREMTRTNYTPWATKARPFAVKTVDVRGFVTKHRASASITSAGGWTTLYVRTRERDIEITLYDTLEDYPSLIRRVVARLEYALARVRYEEAMEPRPDGPPETPYRN